MVQKRDNVTNWLASTVRSLLDRVDTLEKHVDSNVGVPPPMKSVVSLYDLLIQSHAWNADAAEFVPTSHATAQSDLVELDGSLSLHLDPEDITISAERSDERSLSPSDCCSDIASTLEVLQGSSWEPMPTVCGRCNGPHTAEACPYFRKPPERHPDAQQDHQCRESLAKSAPMGPGSRIEFAYGPSGLVSATVMACIPKTDAYSWDLCCFRFDAAVGVPGRRRCFQWFVYDSEGLVLRDQFLEYPYNIVATSGSSSLQFLAVESEHDYYRPFQSLVIGDMARAIGAKDEESLKRSLPDLLAEFRGDHHLVAYFLLCKVEAYRADHWFELLGAACLFLQTAV